MFVKQSTQEFGVLLVVSAADFANAVEGAESAGISLSSKHHHLVRVDVHSNVLVYAKHNDKQGGSIVNNVGVCTHTLQ